MGHLSKSDTTFLGSPYMTDREHLMLEAMISMPRVQAQPGQAPAEGVPVNAVLELMAGFAEAIKNLQVNVAPAAVTVVPHLKLPESEVHETTVQRADPKDGKVIRGSRTEVKRTYKD